ncbi:hypothetical protein ACSHUI_00905 [Bacillus subtilis]|uniref:hypothetical protein n=1 Tax=Bacillus subtilis TaxID=1423 RepID=UPI0025C7D700|nr:hypothetical protein [Bacillus subtilis]WCS68031.1 hypothetical protein Goe26_01190 [Bacillus phage vB_BsuM-Goe26]GLI90617.1 hypothetical protein ANABIO4_39690 [Bacillus subtilis]
MAVKTRAHRVSRALDFYKKNTIYFSIGRTTPWEDENNPPRTEDTTPLEEMIGMRKADRVLLVTPYDGSDVPEGTEIIEFVENSFWKVVPEQDALKEYARYVYIETTINPSDLPLGSYRQVGVHSGVVRKEGVSAGKFNLLPDEIEDTGMLELIDNREKNLRGESTRLLLNFIIKF